MSAQPQHAPGTACQPAARHPGPVLGLPAPARTACELPGASQHQPKPLSTAEREKRASREGKRAGALRWSREGAIHKPPSGSGRAGMGWGGMGRAGMGAEPLGVLRASVMPWGGCHAFGAWGHAKRCRVLTPLRGDGQLCLLPNPLSLSCPLRPRPRGLCVAGSGRWPLPGGPLQSLQKGSGHLASPEDSGGRERRALGGV